MRGRRILVCVSLMCLASIPAPVDAQWHLGVYLGGNHTRPADLRIVDPTTSLDITYSRVAFAAEPFKAPQYYGWRFGHGLTKNRNLAVELEFTHLKLFAKTAALVAVRGQAGASVIEGAEPLNARVQRYSMSHGLNFILINLVLRLPLGWPGTGRTALALRAGAGPTLAHAETQINGVSREQYEWSGPGGNASAGVEVRLLRGLTATADYKVTYAVPAITIAGGGTGRTTALTHQLAVGLMARLGR